MQGANWRLQYTAGSVPRRALRTVNLTYANYKKILHGDDGGWPGITSVRLVWADGPKHADDYRAMCIEVLRARHAFENLNRVAFVCPNVHLDGSYIKALSLQRPLVRELDITAWTFIKPVPDMWASKEDMDTLSVSFSDGIHVPDAMDRFMEGAPKCNNLRLINESPVQLQLRQACIDRVVGGSQSGSVVVEGFVLV